LKEEAMFKERIINTFRYWLFVWFTYLKCRWRDNHLLIYIT